MVNIFNRIKSSKHIWPIKRYDLSQELGANLSIIEQKLKNESYRCFKDFMDEMISTISAFREHYNPHSTDPSGNNKKEIKCCEIVEYDFSKYIREYISKYHEAVSQKVLQRLPSIQQNEMRIQAGLASSST